MVAYAGVNATKYAAGGTGDNIIGDGYIKSVEKVWLDSFTVSTALSSADTIVIATIPKNKKLTSVEISIPALGTVTNSTIRLGNSTSSTAYGSVSNWDTAAETLFQLPNTGRQAVTSAATDILLSFTPAVTLTGVTIKSIVRYT